jgi:hypothetical protein
MTKRCTGPRLAAIALALPLLGFSTRSFAQDAPDPPAPAQAPAATDDAAPSDAAPSDAPATSAPRADAHPAADEPHGGEGKSDDLGLEWVWLNADLGFSYMDLKSANLAISPAGGSPITVVDSANSGLAYDFGAGVRLLFLTLGLRARNHTAMNLWQIDAEVGFHGRIGHVDPYLAFRFGYDTVGTLGQSVSVAGNNVAPDVSVHGYNGGAALGFDYYFMHALSLGIEAAGDVVYLKRAAASPPPLPAALKGNPQAQANYNQIAQAYQATASSVGFGFGGFMHVGVHF